MLPENADLSSVKPISAYASDRSLAPAKDAAWPADDWWTAYGDPQLATLIGDEDAAFTGGSYVIVQKYLHDMAAWNALSIPEQERVFQPLQFIL